MQHPLQGVRVLDLTNVVAGPLCSYYLALMGAEVVKIEAPGRGDLSRKMGADRELGAQGMGTAFIAINAGKKSVELDLKSADGKDAFMRLLDGADVVLENFRPGTMERLGLGPAVLQARRPGLVCCSVSGYGQQGEMAGRPSYDQIIQGYCGLMALTGDAETAPQRAGYVVCDSMAAVVAAFAIASALHGKARTGQGSVIDLSMLESSLGTMAAWPASAVLNAGDVPQPLGNQSHIAAPSGTFRTGEGLINIVNNEEHQYAALCRALQAPHLLDDERFATRERRFSNRALLTSMLEEVLAQQPASEWETRLVQAGVPCGRILGLPDALALGQLHERGFLHAVQLEGSAREVTVTGAGFLIDGIAPGPQSPPPLLGQHTQVLLRAAGVPDEQMARLPSHGTAGGEAA